MSTLLHQCISILGGVVLVQTILSLSRAEGWPLNAAELRSSRETEFSDKHGINGVQRRTQPVMVNEGLLSRDQIDLQETSGSKMPMRRISKASKTTNNQKETHTIDRTLMYRKDLYGGDMTAGNRIPIGGSAGQELGLVPNSQYTFWSYGKVKWYLDSSASGARSNVEYAIKEIESKTCIRFQELTSPVTEKSYIKIGSTGSGCNSAVGINLAGTTDMNLENPGCYYNEVALHEMMHAIGFYHEHQRHDRDNYITINFTNVGSGWEYAFTADAASTENDVGVPYNYYSVVHYGSTAFGKTDANGNLLQTIFPKQAGVNLDVDRSNLTQIDVNLIQLTYKSCAVDFATTTTTTSKLTRMVTVWNRLWAWLGFLV